VLKQQLVALYTCTAESAVDYYCNCWNFFRIFLFLITYRIFGLCAQENHTFQFEMCCWVKIIFCDHTNKVEITQQQGRIQNCRQKVFNRGALRLCGGAWHCENENLHDLLYLLFHISIWRACIFLWGHKPN